MWTTCSENETGQDLDLRLSFILAEEPIKLEQVNPSLVFGTRSPQVSLSSPFPSAFYRFLLLLPSRLFIDQERDLQQVQCGYCAGAEDSVISVFTQLHRSCFNLEFETLLESNWHMVADLWQGKVKISGCFKNSTSIVLQQCQNTTQY